MDQIKVCELKIDLYRCLLLKGASGLTDNEIDIAYYLAKDDEIQRVLNGNKKTQ
jgi:hypothetical protein